MPFRREFERFAYRDAPAELEAWRRGRTGFPIIGAAAGHACYQLARMIGARRVFEMGSGFGYSTAWFARAVADFLQREGLGVAAYVDELREHSPFKTGD